MKVIIAGTRDFDSYGHLESFCTHLPFEVTEVVSGACAGADALGERWAKSNGIPVKRFRADWHKHGRSAGPIRNREMADYADALVLFWDGRSRGSKSMLDEAYKRFLEIVVCSINRLPKRVPHIEESTP